MAIDLITQYQGLVDEKFTAESKRELVTNKDYSWTGAHSIKIYNCLLYTSDAADE